MLFIDSTNYAPHWKFKSKKNSIFCLPSATQICTYHNANIFIVSQTRFFSLSFNKILDERFLTSWKRRFQLVFRELLFIFSTFCRRRQKTTTNIAHFIFGHFYTNAKQLRTCKMKKFHRILHNIKTIVTEMLNQKYHFCVNVVE